MHSAGGGTAALLPMHGRGGHISAPRPASPWSAAARPRAEGPKSHSSRTWVGGRAGAKCGAPPAQRPPRRDSDEAAARRPRALPGTPPPSSSSAVQVPPSFLPSFPAARPGGGERRRAKERVTRLLCPRGPLPRRSAPESVGRVGGRASLRTRRVLFRQLLVLSLKKPKPGLLLSWK